MPGNVVSQLESKSFDSPDEKRRPAKTEVDVVGVSGYTLARFRFEPGWRWSECIKPVVNTESCQISHVGLCTAGSITVQMDDGTRATVKAGDSYAIPPGHDAWVEGDQPYEGYEFLSAAEYAKGS
ncbi:cupin domain-containing protein [Arthrobacter mobilis]|uniref:Cupin domain-containing protein n=1 Tax=Arthrobacter mobilis TaxID=2724944 RepID=A0A7X6K6E0_9MICC|nr:cupin domain-containing protein [Arthrobacter mobilis]NKX55160.1 cupin domain-containing protein [Arthrobacter mobilis]